MNSSWHIIIKNERKCAIFFKHKINSTHFSERCEAKFTDDQDWSVEVEIWFETWKIGIFLSEAIWARKSKMHTFRELRGKQVFRTSKVVAPKRAALGVRMWPNLELLAKLRMVSNLSPWDGLGMTLRFDWSDLEISLDIDRDNSVYS